MGWRGEKYWTREAVRRMYMRAMERRVWRKSIGAGDESSGNCNWRDRQYQIMAPTKLQQK